MLRNPMIWFVLCRFVPRRCIECVCHADGSSCLCSRTAELRVLEKAMTFPHNECVLLAFQLG